MQKSNSKNIPQSRTSPSVLVDKERVLDATTFVEFLGAIGYGREHGKTSIRGDVALHKVFMAKVEEDGYQSCDVIDTFKLVYVLSGRFSPENLTLNLHLHHVVERHRRKKHFYEHAPNFYDSKYGVWSYLEGEPLNGNGHVTFCECAQCKRYGNYKS